MLQIHSISRPQDKQIFLQKFDVHGECWIVSDLQSKWHLQRELLDKHLALEQATIMRAAELWRQLAFQLRPEIRLLTFELAQTLFWDWVEPLNLPWARSPQSIPVILKQMQTWMGIFADPNHEELMGQWFTDNPDSYVRWGHWFQLCSHLWKRCRENDYAMMPWLPAIILNEDISRLEWPRKFNFDLGPQMSPIEGQLIRELSRTLDVDVLYPEVPWQGFMNGVLKPYESLLPAEIKSDPQWQPLLGPEVSFGRFSTQLAEVKDAVARVREWLESGVPAAKIAIVAPDMEDCWPVLSLYLEQEGVPVNRPRVARLGSFSEMAQWLAKLRTTLLQVSTDNLEILLFTQQDKPALPFDQFQILFTHIYDSADTSRAEHLFTAESLSAEDLESLTTEAQTLAEFLPWSLRLWSGSAETSRLMALLQILGQEVPREIRLTPKQWLTYLERLLATRDISLDDPEENGIWCVSLPSAHGLNCSHGIFLNLNENALRQVEISPVNSFEADKILKDTGYALGATDRQEMEFEFLWFLQRPWQELRLGFSATDFQGQVLTPSRLWMWAGFANEQLKERAEVPRTTRWDEIQRQHLQEIGTIRGWGEEQVLALKEGIQRDTVAGVGSWGPSKEIRLSASSLERFWDCPFVFAAERKLKLTDEPVIDLDLDHRGRGRLLHSVVEKLLEEPLNLERSEGEIGELIDRVRDAEGIRVADSRLWIPIQRQHIRLARMFLDFERDWRLRFPETKTWARELAFKCYWDLGKGMPTLTAPEADTRVTLSGRIDRVDSDGRGHHVVIDYKSSSAGLTNWETWLKNHEVQLAFYSYLIECGVVKMDGDTSTEKPTVVAANYYVIKEGERRKGFHMNEVNCQLFDSAYGRLKMMNPDDKAMMFETLRSMIQEALEKMVKGEFNSNPRDTSLCPSCNWSKLCRSPHLN